jgi:hypothetical protein
MAHLYPLSEEKFMQLHREAWENGWVYGPGFKELYDDYLVNWVYFVDFLDYLIRTKNGGHPRQYNRFGSGPEPNLVAIKFEDSPVARIVFAPDLYEIDKIQNIVSVKKTDPIILKIFIGEAPPYWKGNSKNNERTYFYNPEHIAYSPWLNIPCQIFKIDNSLEKIKRLKYLADRNVILLDIFPFPIIQDTEVRQNISGEFGKWIDKFFNPHFEKCVDYINGNVKGEIQKEYAIATPLYSALQICFGETTRDSIQNSIEFDKPISEIKNISPNDWSLVPKTPKKDNVKIGEKSKRFEFLEKINPDKIKSGKSLIEILKEGKIKIPLLTTGKNSLSKSVFINSKKRNP